MVSHRLTTEGESGHAVPPASVHAGVVTAEPQIRIAVNSTAAASQLVALVDVVAISPERVWSAGEPPPPRARPLRIDVKSSNLAGRCAGGDLRSGGRLIGTCRHLADGRGPGNVRDHPTGREGAPSRGPRTRPLSFPSISGWRARLKGPGCARSSSACGKEDAADPHANPKVRGCKRVRWQPRVPLRSLAPLGASTYRIAVAGSPQGVPRVSAIIAIVSRHSHCVRGRDMPDLLRCAGDFLSLSHAPGRHGIKFILTRSLRASATRASQEQAESAARRESARLILEGEAPKTRNPPRRRAGAPTNREVRETSQVRSSLKIERNARAIFLGTGVVLP